MTRQKLGAFAVVIGSLIIVSLPASSFGAGSTSAELKAAREALVKAGQQLQAGLESTVQKTGDATAGLLNKSKQGVKQATGTRATATDPPTQPPMHGTNPHGQGTVGVVDTAPSAERPLAADPDGGDSGEEVVVGRARGEQNADGTYHGHITVLGLFGNDVIPVDSAPGESKTGPLQQLQTSVLDPLCTSTTQQVCLSVLTANSVTTDTGSANDFALARASLFGLGVGGAESNGTIAQDANCQTAVGAARTGNVATSGGAVAEAASSGVASQSCRGQAPVVRTSGEVINLGGTGVPTPAAGCANGTPDTQTGLPGLLPIICNAEEIAGAAAVREALAVFALQVGTNSLLKEATAASEALSVAPEAGTQCTDTIDNDGDGVIDINDPGCHTDNNAGNPASSDPTDNDETDRRAPTGGGGDDDEGDDDGASGGSGRGDDGAGGAGGGLFKRFKNLANRIRGLAISTPAAASVRETLERFAVRPIDRPLPIGEDGVARLLVTCGTEFTSAHGTVTLRTKPRSADRKPRQLGKRATFECTSTRRMPLVEIQLPEKDQLLVKRLGRLRVRAIAEATNDAGATTEAVSHFTLVPRQP